MGTPRVNGHVSNGPLPTVNGRISSDILDDSDEVLISDRVIYQL